MTIRSLARDAIAGLASVLGVSAPQRVLRGRLLILTFHRVLPAEQRDRYPYPGLVVTPDELDWILSRYAALFPVSSLSDALERMVESGWRSPQVAVTFDDGQWDGIQYAAPVLARHNVKATFYVPVDAINSQQLLWHDRAGFGWQQVMSQPSIKDELPMPLRSSTSAEQFAEHLKSMQPPDRERVVALVEQLTTPEPPDWARLMTWQEVGELADAGHEIGSHSMSHGLLTQMSPESQRYELEQSKLEIEEVVGRRVVSFCYPNGDHDRRTADIAKAVGYTSAVTTKWGVEDAVCSRFQLRRCDMDVRHFRSDAQSLSGSVLDFRIAGLAPGLPT